MGRNIFLNLHARSSFFDEKSLGIRQNEWNLLYDQCRNIEVFMESVQKILQTVSKYRSQFVLM
jgi:hypothetical protein